MTKCLANTIVQAVMKKRGINVSNDSSNLHKSFVLSTTDNNSLSES